MPKRPNRDALPDELPEWERVLSAAATHAGQRLSRDADHVLTDLRIKAALILKRNATRD